PLRGLCGADPGRGDAPARGGKPMRRGAIAPVLLLLVALAPRVRASDRQIPMADYVQAVWEARDGGLPNPTVTAIVQTRDGYLWVGTYAGLARFDGLEFHLPSRQGYDVYRAHVRGLLE